jgi:hypothetical protein
VSAQERTAQAVSAPWAPAVGDYVRVEPSGGCKSMHARFPSVGPLYGRVEGIDRTWDDEAEWIASAIAEGEDLDDARAFAQNAAGHYYYVSDSLGGESYSLVDEQFAAAELVKVNVLEAVPAILRLRDGLRSLSKPERAGVRLLGLVGALS